MQNLFQNDWFRRQIKVNQTIGQNLKWAKGKPGRMLPPTLSLSVEGTFSLFFFNFAVMSFTVVLEQVILGCVST